MSSLISSNSTADAPRSVALATNAHKWADTTKIKRNIAQVLRTHRRPSPRAYPKEYCWGGKGGAGGREFFGQFFLRAGVNQFRFTAGLRLLLCNIAVCVRAFGLGAFSTAQSTCQSFTNHCIFGLCTRSRRKLHTQMYNVEVHANRTTFNNFASISKINLRS